MADSSTYTPETLQRRYAMAQALLADPKQPIRHWAQGLNELAKGLVGGYQFRNTEKLEAGQREAANQQVMQALGLGQPPAAAPALPSAGPTPAPAPSVLGAGGAPATPDAQGVYGSDAVMMPPGGGSAPDFGKSIAGIESGGQKDPYSAVGPVTKTGDKAYGKYQVMGSNIPAWTKEHLGQEMTPEQFLANPQAQDAVFKGQFGKYVQQTGNPQDAASMWFTGKPLAQGAGLSDQLGTTGQGYVDKFNAGMGGPPAPAVGAISTALNAPAGVPPAAPPAPAGAAPSPAVSNVAQTLAKPPLAPPAGVGVNPNARAIAAVLTSPWVDPGVKAAVMQQSSPSFGFQTLPDGTVVRTDPKKGTIEEVYRTQAKPQFVPNVSPNQYGVAQPGFVDPYSMKAFDITGKPMTNNPSAPAAGVNPDVTGEDFLKTLPKPQADQIKGIVEGRISPPGAFALKTPYWQKMLTDVAQYEPGFDLTKWGARAATAKDFASGKSAQNITSFNTALGHLDTLDKAIDGLKNSDFPAYNSVSNWLASQGGNTEFQKARTRFETARQAVTDELTRAFRGTGGNVSDIKDWESKINSAQSPAALHEATKQAVELLRSRIEALGETYNRGMSTTLEPIKLLSPKAQAAITRLSGEKAPETPAAAPAPAAAASTAPKVPDVGEVRSGYRFKGGNPADKASWEAVAPGPQSDAETTGAPSMDLSARSRTPQPQPFAPIPSSVVAANGGTLMMPHTMRSESTQHEIARRLMQRTPPVSVLEGLIGGFSPASQNWQSLREAIRRGAGDKMKAAGEY